MMVKTAPNMESPEEKLKWIFNTFDKGLTKINCFMTEEIDFVSNNLKYFTDGGGNIDDDEVYGVVHTLFKMIGKEISDDELDEIVDDILEKVDANGDGVISEKEFIENAMKSEFLADVVKNHT